ncbi:hypothetical protein [Paraburkholderia sacchari]|uniref:hypothetical protein n=1 Tax=Paraburkholderia sacchari TaxID=159450 RepID=UPI003D97AA6D
MARIVITPEQWARARLQWESEPLVTYADIAEDLGIRRQSVRERAVREQWQRRLDLQAVAEKAHAQADSKFTYSPVDSPEQAALPVADAAEFVRRAPILPSGLPQVPAGVPLEQAQAAVEKAAVDQRSEVLTKHRKEILHVRQLAYDSIAEMRKPSGDPDKAFHKGRHAKVIAETMKLVQEAERKAWGLDAEPPKPGTPGAPVKVTVVRKPGRVPT